MSARTRLLSCLVLVAAAGAPVGAQESAPPADALRGPEVKDRDVPGVPSTFGEVQPGQGQRQRGVRHPVFMRAIESLSGEDVAADLRPTEAQLDEIRTIEQEYQDAVRAYMQEHAAEMRELRAKAGIADRGPGGARGPGDRPGAPDAPGAGDDRPPQRPGFQGRRGPAEDPASVTPEMQEARARLQEIREGAPKADEYHVRIYEVLTEPQREHVKNMLARYQEEMRAREMEGRREGAPPRERRGFDPARAGGSMTDDAAPPAEPVDEAAEWDRLRAEFESLSPGQRRELLRRIGMLIERAKENQRPIPPTDSVDIPSMSE